jgi:hypothetical protein
MSTHVGMLILSRNTILPNLHTAVYLDHTVSIYNGTKHFRESRTQQVRALRAIPPRKFFYRTSKIRSAIGPAGVSQLITWGRTLRDADSLGHEPTRDLTAAQTRHGTL